MVWMVIGGGIVVIVLAVLLSRARVPHDGVDNFRRQIDALSPEARRPVVGRVNEARQTTRDHGLTVRRVTPVVPTNGVENGVDGTETDYHPDLDDDSADRRTGHESGGEPGADDSSELSTGGDSGSAASDTTSAVAGDNAHDDGGAAGESLDGS